MSRIIAPEWDCTVMDNDPDNPNHYQPVWLNPEQRDLIKALFDAAYDDHLEAMGLPLPEDPQ